MIATGHTAVGFIIGSVAANSFQNPVVGSLAGFGAGLASHYLLDFIPHGHLLSYDKLHQAHRSPLLHLDLVGGGLLFVLLAYFTFGISVQTLVVLSAIAGSLLPDVLASQLYYPGKVPPKSGIFNKEYKLHMGVHWHGREDKTRPLSLIDVWQAGVILGALFLPNLFK